MQYSYLVLMQSTEQADGGQASSACLWARKKTNSSVISENYT